MALNYRQVSDMYRLLSDVGATQLSLPEWSAQMNQASGSDIYSEGQNDNWIKRASVGIDRGLEAIPGLIPASRGFGRAVGGAFGMPEVGADIGATLPRTAINFLPMLIPGVGAGATVARLGGMAALSGAGAYTETGSPAAGVVAGLTAAAMPKVADLAEQGILRALGATRVAGKIVTEVGEDGLPLASESVSRYFGNNPFQRLTSFTGGNVAAAGLTEGATLGQEALSGQELHDPFTKENLLANVLGTLPFAAAQIASNPRALIDGPKRQAAKLEAQVRQGESLLRVKEAMDAQKEQSDIEKVPVIPEEQKLANPEVQAQTEELLSTLGQRRDIIKSSPDPTNVEALKSITQQETQAVSNLIQQTGGIGVGTSQPKATDAKVTVIGENQFIRDQPNGKGYHTITVSNDPRNAGLTYPDGTPIMPGDRIRFPMGFADPTVNRNPNDPTFLLPKNKFTKVTDKFAEERRAAQESDELPPVPAGHVRFYHGGVPGEGGRWVSQDIKYAEGYASKSPNGIVQYVDIPKTDTQLRKSFDDSGLPYESPYVHFETDDITAKGFKPVKTRLKQAELPEQKLTLDLEQHAENLKSLDALEVQGRAMTSYGEFLDLLTKVNTLREASGYPEIDVATLMKRAKDAKIPSDQKAALALIAETKTMQLAEQAAKVERMEEMQGEVDFQAKLLERAQKGDEQAANVLKIYEDLSAQSGRRGEVATSGLFWRKAMELDAEGKLTASRMANWKEGDVVMQGTGLKKGEKLAAPTSNYIFKPLDPEDAAMIETVGRAAMKAIQGTQFQDEAQVFKQLVLRGDLSFKHESIVEAALDSGVVDTRAEAGTYANEFLESPHVRDWARQVLTVFQQNEKPPMLTGAPREAKTAMYIQELGPEILNRSLRDTEGEQFTVGDLLDDVRWLNRPDALAKLNEHLTWARSLDQNQVLGKNILGENIILGDVITDLQWLQRADGETYAPREAFVPASESQKVMARSLTGDGNNLAKLLETSVDPEIRQIVSDLKKNFPNSLGMVSSQVSNVPGSYASMGADRRVTIHFNPELLAMRPAFRENIMLHEMIHGITMHEVESGSRPELVKELSSLRRQTIDALPKDLRAAYDNAIKTNFLRRNMLDRTGTVWQELGPDASSRGLLYGLLTNHEFLAQGFTDKSFRNFLQKIPAKGEGTLFNKFAKWVKGLLGLGEKVDSTLFARFLDTSSQLMTHGEFMSTAQKYGESYFLNQGHELPYAKEQTTRALGLIAESAEGLTKEQTISSLNFSQSETNQRLTRARAIAEGAFEGDDGPMVKSVLNELGHEDGIFGLEGLLVDGLIFEKDISLAMDFMPPEISNYMYEKLSDSYDVLDVVSKMVKRDQVVNIADPSKLRRPINDALKSVEKLLEHQEASREAAQSLSQISAVEPGAYVARIASAPKELDNFFESGKSAVNGVGNWLTRFLEPMGQLARRVPEAAEILSKGFELAPNARQMFNKTVKPFGIDGSSDYLDPNPTKESVRLSQKVFSEPKLLDAANRWVYWSNKLGGDKVVMLGESNPEVAKVLSKLTPEERAAVHDVVAKQSRSIQALNAEKVQKMTEIAAVHGAGLVMADGGVKTKDAVALSDTLLKGVMDMSNPARAVLAQQQIASVQQRMQPEAFFELLQYTQGEAQKIGMMKEYLEANPAWATAQRMERYLVRYSVNGKPKLGQASSLIEAREIAAKGKHVEITDQWKGRDDEPFAFPDMPPQTVDRMRQIEENQIQMLMRKGILDESNVEEYRKTSAVTQIVREGAAQQQIPGMTPPPRMLQQGADELPWLWNHISYAQRQSNYWSRALLRAQVRTYLRDPELASNPQLRKDLNQHFQNMFHPDPIWAQNAKQAMSVWFLGFNAATGLVNSLQPLFTHAAELTALSGKPLDSYKRLFRAMKEIGGRSVEGKEWASEEHRRFNADAVHDGEVGIGKFDDDAAAQEAIATNFKRVMMKNKTQSLGQKLSTGAGIYSEAAMWLFKHGERFNSRVALLSAFDYYREQGLDYNAAKAKAYEFNRATNFSGGRAQRSIGMFSGTGAFPRSTAMLASSLQSYVWGTTFQIVRYLQHGGFRPSGLTPHEVYSARKAGVQLLATQLVAAGALGMPFVSGAIALLEKAFPDLELNKNLRQTVNGFLSSDDENGNILTDIAMTGLPSTLGWDLQSRMSMGNSLPGVSEINGFQPENLMGPAANLVRNFVGGVTGWATGKPGAGLKFLPPAVGKLVDVAQSTLGDNGQIRDYAGRPLDRPTAGEHLGLTLGFQPKRLSDQNAAARIVQQSEDVQNRREGQFRSEQAEQVLQGNFGNVKGALLSRSRSDGQYDLAAAIRGIARTAEEQYFPRDLRREGTKGTATVRSQILASYTGVSPQAGSEVERLQFRKKIEMGLGLQSDWKRELTLAQMMDQLKAQNPGASRVELRSAAQTALQRNERRGPSLSLE